MGKNKIVIKANNDIISFCECASAFATQGQADCPWCGCGWLFTCFNCRKAFTFGKVIETEMTSLEIGRKLIRSSSAIDDEDALEAADWLNLEMKPLKPKQTVIFLDGGIRPLNSPAEFNGWFAKHKFEHLPHYTANKKAELVDILGRPEYWLERKLST